MKHHDPMSPLVAKIFIKCMSSAEDRDDLRSSLLKQGKAGYVFEQPVKVSQEGRPIYLYADPGGVPRWLTETADGFHYCDVDGQILKPSRDVWWMGTVTGMFLGFRFGAHGALIGGAVGTLAGWLLDSRYRRPILAAPRARGFVS